jgi:uncharacterized protein YqcC (DUF446 family)
MSEIMPRGALEVQVDALLVDLEGAMKKTVLWASRPPSDRAMQSAAPFACDRMTFEQWLQFIFIPRIRALMAQAKPLPDNIALYPMGQEMFKEKALDVLVILRKIDQRLSEQY